MDLLVEGDGRPQFVANPKESSKEPMGLPEFSSLATLTDSDEQKGTLKVSMDVRERRKEKKKKRRIEEDFLSFYYLLFFFPFSHLLHFPSRRTSRDKRTASFRRRQERRKEGEGTRRATSWPMSKSLDPKISAPIMKQKKWVSFSLSLTNFLSTLFLLSLHSFCSFLRHLSCSGRSSERIARDSRRRHRQREGHNFYTNNIHIFYFHTTAI